MANPATLADLRSQVDDLAGLGLSPTERDRLLNEGHVELCVRSGWSKGTLALGPGVAGQELYPFPATLRKPLKVTVAGLPYTNTDQAALDSYRLGRTYIPGDGAWWINYGATAARSIGITPATDGGTISVLGIVTPATMTADADQPIVPPDFRQAIVDYVSAISLGAQEDLIEDRVFHRDEFERQVIRLRGLAMEIEEGDATGNVQLAGVHF